MAESDERTGRSSSREHQLYLALAVMIFLNFALISSMVTFWALVEK